MQEITTLLKNLGPPHNKPEKFEKRSSHRLVSISGRKSRDYRDVIFLEKPRFQNVFCPHENEKPSFSNSSGLKSVFEKLRRR